MGAGGAEADRTAEAGHRRIRRRLAPPNSSVVPAEQLQGFIDGVPVGTNYCVRTKALSEDVYLVDLSEMRPDGVQRITQTVATATIDGTWFVDVFN